MSLLKKCTHFGRNWARPPRRRHMVFGLQTQPKSWLTGYTFWVNHYLEIVFSKISVVNPPPPPLKCNFIYFMSYKKFYKISKNANSRSNFDTLKANKSIIENIIVPNMGYCLKRSILFLNMDEIIATGSAVPQIFAQSDRLLTSLQILRSLLRHIE